VCVCLPDSLEGRKTNVIRESGVKDESEARDFPASGSDSRFANVCERADVRAERRETGKRREGGKCGTADPSRGF